VVCVQVLLEWGAAIELLDDGGKSARDLTTKDEVVKIIKQHEEMREAERGLLEEEEKVRQRL
jgi:hypothetical protein